MMDETAVRTLLRAIADTPEPPALVSLDRARRRGLRRLWIRRAAAPALVMVAVAGIVTVPRALSPDHPERSVTSPRHQTVSAPVSAPARFNPLVPYATFGWLPPGFSESAATSIDLDLGFSSGTDYVSLEAADLPAGHLLYLQVNARGSCPFTIGDALRDIRDLRALQVSCADDGFAATSTAPRVSGRPAVWIDYGDGIAWEYAPGASASLTASITPAADEPHSRRHAAEDGWVLMPRTSADRANGVGPPAQIQAAIASGKLIPPSAATMALLVKVASHVRYGQTTPLSFPFRLPSPLPAGWRLTQATFTVSGGRMTGDGITAGPAADPAALSIGSGSGSCSFIDGQSSYVTRLGVQWVYRVLNEPEKHWQNLCTTGTVNGVTGIDVSLDMNTPGSNAPLPGSAELGGTLGVLARTRFLGASPALWTTAPLG